MPGDHVVLGCLFAIIPAILTLLVVLLALVHRMKGGT